MNDIIQDWKKEVLQELKLLFTNLQFHLLTLISVLFNEDVDISKICEDTDIT